MPMLTKCHNCGFDGPHGFSSSAGPRMLSVYHQKRSADGGTEYCLFYRVTDHGKSREFKTRKAAWKYARTLLAHEDSTWLAAWDAEIGGHPRKARKLFQQWNDRTLVRA